jgi:Zn-dependent protease/predicted transcriptional regulator
MICALNAVLARDLLLVVVFFMGTTPYRRADMGWSFRVGRLAGIDIFVHFTFLILLGWVAIWGYMATGNVAVAASGVVLTLAVFAIIVMHEMGHALTARAFGIGTKDITLLPIGGVARLERMPDKPWQELLVALAGPAVNVVLAIIFGAIAIALQIPVTEENLSYGGNLILLLFVINVTLVLFNMLPAFPMDGGRVLRALLAMRLGNIRATQIAARIGQGMAIVFAIAGLIVPGYFMLLLIAFFVWVGAAAEAEAVLVKSGLNGVPVSSVMVRQFNTVAPDDTLQEVSRHVIDGFQQDFPVVVGGRMVGLLTRSDLLYGMSELGPEARVVRVMRREFPTISPGEPAEHGLAMLSSGVPVVPVVDFGRVVGLLTAENLTEYLWIRRALRGELPHEAARDAVRSSV